jgi:hypothetical protein
VTTAARFRAMGCQLWARRRREELGELQRQARPCRPLFFFFFSKAALLSPSCPLSFSLPPSSSLLIRLLRLDVVSPLPPSLLRQPQLPTFRLPCSALPPCPCWPRQPFSSRHPSSRLDRHRTASSGRALTKPRAGARRPSQRSVARGSSARRPRAPRSSMAGT